ncbi:hypothetical protein ACFQ61_02060 [Streptomyces sp. NPDC056500]|uniref:hypothetical protein n=1 Tax=Streptomyces sp. NPDC056500 TaxID=3345840 RepID=UPI00367FFF19
MTIRTAPDTAAAEAGHRAAADLRAIREQWGDLLTAIAQPPPPVWPPVECREWEQPPPDDTDTGPTVGRLPLTLREHPAPLNLTALDAAVAVETALFALADQVATTVQRPVRYTATARHGRHRYQPDPADHTDPARWHPATADAPGSRTHGLHWAAVWLEGRAYSEQDADLFGPTPDALLTRIEDTARAARRRVDRALGRDGRSTVLAQPCPYCRGMLTAHSRSGDPMAATIVCATGRWCTAPVLLDGRGRRVWSGADLVGLYVALTAKS